MLIEHTFVTTLPSETALALSSDLLGLGGFTAESNAGFDLAGGGGWTALQMRRGKKSANRAKNVADAPQRVSLQWDRGRVSFAGVIDPPANRNTVLAFGLIGLLLAAQSRRGGKRDRPYADLMLSIAQSVEDVATGKLELEPAADKWLKLEQGFREKAAKARRRSYIYLGIFLAVVIAFIVILVMNVK